MDTPPSPSALPRRRPDFSERAAFTLVELLSVVAIIGLLVAILLPTIGYVRETAKASRCTTNLRQTGLSIQNYVADNQGFLPPVGHLSISPYFNADTRNFQSALLPYLSTSKTTSWATSTLQGKAYSPTLECPGYKGDPVGSCFSIRESVTMPDGSSLIPWGRIYQVGSQFLLTRKPSKHTIVPANAVALIDRDFSVTERNHSGFQNALYFDWHVDRVAVTN